jgi:hypothetical protein
LYAAEDDHDAAPAKKPRSGGSEDAAAAGATAKKSKKGDVVSRRGSSTGSAGRESGGRAASESRPKQRGKAAVVGDDAAAAAGAAAAGAGGPVKKKPAPRSRSKSRRAAAGAGGGGPSAESDAPIDLAALKAELLAEEAAALAEMAKGAAKKVTKKAAKKVTKKVAKKAGSSSRGARDLDMAESGRLHAAVAEDDRAPALYCAQLAKEVYSDAVIQFKSAASKVAKKSVVLSHPVAGDDAPTVSLRAGMSDKKSVQWGVFHLEWTADDRHVLVVAFRGSEATNFEEFWHDWITTDLDVTKPTPVKVSTAKPPAEVLLHAGFNRAFE